MGGYGAYLVMVASAPTDPAQYAGLRHGIDFVCRWLVLPSLPLVLISGLFAIAAHQPFIDQTWVWVKAATGVLVFEATLNTINSHGKAAAEFALLAAQGKGDPAGMAEAVRGEWGTLWVLMGLGVFNVVVGVWRPRFKRKPEAETPQPSDAPEKSSDAPEKSADAPEKPSDAPEKSSEASEKPADAPEKPSDAPEKSADR